MGSRLLHAGLLLEGFGICLPTALLLVAYSVGGLPPSLNFALPTFAVVAILAILAGITLHLLGIIRVGGARPRFARRLQWFSAILAEMVVVSIFFNTIDYSTASLACGPPGSEIRCYEARVDMILVGFFLGVLLFNIGTLGSLQVWSWNKTRSATLKSELRIDEH